MRWLVVVLGAQLLVDLVVLIFGDASDSPVTTAMEIAALAVDGVVVVLLSRATEFTRALIRGAAAAGMVIDTWILLGVLMWLPRDAAGLLAIATSFGLVAASGFAWVVLGRADVRAWIFDRWLCRALPQLSDA